MVNGLQDVKLTDINVSTHPKDRQQALKLEGLDYYKQFAVALLWFSLGSNFSSFETKQRKVLLNQRAGV